jgi:Cu2+-exporting ATPase
METQHGLIAYQVVHTTPERIRVYIPKLTSDSDYKNKLNFLAINLADVTEIRISEYASSLIVNYASSVESNDTRISNLQIIIQQANDSNLQIGVSRPEASEKNPFERLILPTVGLGLAISAVSFGTPIPPLLLATITLISAIPIFIKTLGNVLRGQIDTEILNTVWTVFHTLEGEYIAPNLEMTVASSAEVLREATGHNTLPLIKARLPLEVVRVERDEKEIKIPVGKLVYGDTLILYPGDISPVDGRILTGEGFVDISILTGEATPIVATPGEALMAYSLVLEGKLRVIVEELPQETNYAVESHIASNAPRHLTEISEYAQDVGNAIIIPTLAMSGITYLLTANVNQSLAFLTLDLATGISISAPTAILSSMSRAKRSGIYVESGHALERLTQADVVVFSKTGTLTQGSLRVLAVEVFGDITETELVSFAASVKEGFHHPVATALIRYAQAQGIELLPCKNWQHRRDFELGVSAEIGSRLIFVGSSAYLQEQGISCIYFPDQGIGLLETEAQGIWRVYVAADGQLLGRISCCDDICPESPQVVASLRSRGLEVHMVTGNNWEVANNVASWVGIAPEFVHAEVTPQYKVELLQGLQANGKKVVFLGEGMDDYPAMCYADVAIGTDRSCPLVAETAAVLLPYGNLPSLLILLDIATETINIIQQNIAIITVPNISIVMCGVFFALEPTLAVILNNAVNILAELNALRPLLNFTDEQ